MKLPFVAQRIYFAPTGSAGTEAGRGGRFKLEPLTAGLDAEAFLSSFLAGL